MAAALEAEALPVVDLSIKRGVTKEHFIVQDRRTFVEAQARDPELQLLRTWMQASKIPTTVEFASESPRMKQLAPLSDFVSERENLLFFRCQDNPEQELTLAPAEMVERIIRYFHEGREAHIKLQKQLLPI